jgi:hypothetical protein
MTKLDYTDIWNFSILPPDQNKGPLNIGGKQVQMNPAVLNKLKMELILHHLTFLRYNNIPKINVLQSMTTPKNWLNILHILQFLGNLCIFTYFYNGKKLLYTFDNKETEIINEFLSKNFFSMKTESNFLESDEQIELKDEYLRKYEGKLKEHANLKQLHAEVETLRKNNEHLKKTMVFQRKKLFDF